MVAGQVQWSFAVRTGEVCVGRDCVLTDEFQAIKATGTLGFHRRDPEVGKPVGWLS
jgi:hypothetical protein